MEGISLEVLRVAIGMEIILNTILVTIQSTFGETRAILTTVSAPTATIVEFYFESPNTIYFL